MSAQRVIALLGRRDEPTDAVEEYCRYLGSALGAHKFHLEIERFAWEKVGWPQAFAQLEKSAPAWRGQLVLVQYTALAWSARGFPQKVLRVLKSLRSAGCRVGVVFHDVEPFPGRRLVDRFRRIAQIRTMRRILQLADTAIFTVPPEKLTWLTRLPSNTHFIPVGPNFAIPATFPVVSTHSIPTIGVFSITGGAAGADETKVILSAVRGAAQKLGQVRLSIFGRHAELREAELRRGLQNCSVELSVEGVVDPDGVVQRLLACDVLLFVRGPISSRRSSAISAIACGLPIIAYSGTETAAPVTEAGVILVPVDQPDQIQAALIRVLSDPPFRADLAARSRLAYQNHFAWSAIAARFAALLSSR
jgi:glycosyltransferase involved in cell wall biosynthesis